MADMGRKGIHRCRCRGCRSRSNTELVTYHRAINRVMAELDERSRRLFAGILARQRGHGGVQQVAEITGLSRMTIRRGLRESERGQAESSDRVRSPGGGRKRVEKKHLAYGSIWRSCCGMRRLVIRWEVCDGRTRPPVIWPLLWCGVACRLGM